MLIVSVLSKASKDVTELVQHDAWNVGSIGLEKFDLGYTIWIIYRQAAEQIATLSEEVVS